MTRLCCFYTNLDPRAEDALKRFAPQAGLDIEWVETPGPGMVYADELEKRWTGEDDLIVVEQDKEIHAGTLPSIMTCANYWCACTYWLFPVPHTTLCTGGFGVTKFSAKVQRLVKVEDFAGEQQAGIDRRLWDLLVSMGIPVCLHNLVIHHHVYEPRPESVRRHVENLRENGTLPPAIYPEPAGPHLLPGSYDLKN
jgi:hypothetical protein